MSFLNLKREHSNFPTVWRWEITVASFLLLLFSALLAVSFGPIHLSFTSIVKTLLGIQNTIATQDRAVLLYVRVPRVLLAALVGSALATSGAVYQSVFRNPLADPYLLGAAAGAGLGATIAFTSSTHNLTGILPILAFGGATIAVLASFFISGRFFADPSSLVLSGIAVGSFATAVQTYLQQRHSAILRPVYSWILGELTAATWSIVGWSALYIFISFLVLRTISKRLDALMLSDEEAFSLGVNPRKLRIIAVVAATLLTATAVAASGLIGFVGIVVPHLVRGITRSSTNRALPSIALVGASFLVIADLGARTLVSPAELPIGVITAFVGAPFFLYVLRRKRMG